MRRLSIARSTRLGSQPTYYTGDNKDPQTVSEPEGRHRGEGWLDGRIMQSNPLSPTLSRMSKGAKMQAVFRNGQLLRV